MSVFRIEKNANYTVMSNYHLRDKSLPLKAKGLLSVMLSLPEDWDYTLKGLATLSADGLDTVRSAVNALEQAGYITRRQTSDERGRFAGNEYHVYEYPPSASPSSASPLSGNPITEKSSTGKPLSEKATQLNKERTNKDQQSKDSPSTDSFLPSEAAPATDGRTERESIREQIEYTVLVNPGNRAQLDELVEIMVEVAMNRSPTVKIGRDAEYPAGFVQDRFRQITSEHIEKVLDGIRENTTRVKNTRAYLLAALFNSVSTLDNHYTMLVNHDFHNGI